MCVICKLINENINLRLFLSKTKFLESYASKTRWNGPKESNSFTRLITDNKSRDLYELETQFN